MNTKEKILKYIEDKGSVRAEDLNQELDVSRVTIHKQLLKLQEEGLIVKSGKPPKVYYFLSKKDNNSTKNTKQIRR